VGLDYKDATDDQQRARQRDALAAQLEWAAAERKAVHVHCRRAERDIVTTCAEFARSTGLGVDLHWFTHSTKLARRCGEAGLYISPGPSTRHDPREADVARRIDGDLLLLETDSPVEYGGEAARPVWARRVAERLAALRGENLDSLAARVRSNFERYRGMS